MRHPRRWSLAAQILVMQVLVALVVVGVGVEASYLQARGAGEQAAVAQVLAVARTVAATPEVVDAVGTADASTALQPLAEEVRADTGTDFVVVMSTDGTRYTHPDPTQIGGTFLGTIAPAQEGRDVTETYTGTLGPSVRAVVPVVRDGEVAGLVSVGIRTTTVADALERRLPALLLAALLAAGLSGLGTWLVARHVRRQTHGLGAEEMRRMYEYYDAVLHAVREGLLLVDTDGRIRLVNDEARRLLDLPRDTVGMKVAALALPDLLRETIVTGDPRTDALFVTAARVVVLNQAPATWRGRPVGTVVTLRDRTDLEALTGELDTARGLSEALRSQAHESANRLHTVVSLIELGRPEDALDFATGELSAAQRLTDAVVESVEEPALAALLLGKSAQASERGIDLTIEPGTSMRGGLAPSHDLVTIVGNLLDNAMDAVAEVPGRKEVRVAAGVFDDEVVLEVSDNGPGLPDGMQAFERGYTTKQTTGPGGRGLGLALVRQSVRRLGGTIEVSGPPGAHFVVTLPVKEVSGDRATT